jgi:rod shape-determining protein MreC
MRNIFLFFRRFSVLILFLIMQGIALSILVQYSRSHQAWYMQTAYEVTGRINGKANGVKSYFALQENNRLIAEENTLLKNQSPNSFIVIDTTAKTVIDTSYTWDTTRMQRKYYYRTAQVVSSSTSLQKNYVEVQRGSNQGVTKDQSVVSAGGIVGLVTDVSGNFANVMSLLNRDVRTSVLMKNDRASGILAWDGKSPDRLQLTISKSALVKVGDTVLTSNLSSYPPGLMVGTVEKIEDDAVSGSHLLQVKPGANFRSLQYVDVVENLFLKEQQEMQERVKQKQKE